MAAIDDLNAKLDEALSDLAAAKTREEATVAALQAIIDANGAGTDLSGPLAKAQAIIDAANAIDPAPVAPVAPPAA